MSETVNRHYPLPDPNQPQRADAVRIAAAVTAIDADIAALLLTLGGKASSADIGPAISAAIDALIAGAPAALDTLAEVAAKLADNDDAVAAIMSSLAGKANAANVYSRATVDTKFADEVAARAAAIALAVAGMAKTNVAQQFTKPQRSGVFALTSAPVITIDGNAIEGNILPLLLEHHAILANPVNLLEGTTFCIIGQQNSVGGFTLAYESLWFPIGRVTAPSIPTAPNAKFRVTGQVGPAGRIDYLAQGVGA